MSSAYDIHRRYKPRNSASLTRPRFLLDVDEILTDFVDRAIGVISSILGRPWTLDEVPSEVFDIFSGLEPEQVDACFKVICAEGFCATFKPKEGSQRAVEELQKTFDLYLVTSPNHTKHWIPERLEWLQRFYDIRPEQVVFTYAKHVCSGSFFLDDCPEHVLSWKDHHPEGVAMLWDTPNNYRLSGYENLRVTSWEEVFQKTSRNLLYDFF